MDNLQKVKKVLPCYCANSTVLQFRNAVLRISVSVPVQWWKQKLAAKVTRSSRSSSSCETEAAKAAAKVAAVVTAVRTETEAAVKQKQQQ